MQRAIFNVFPAEDNPTKVTIQLEGNLDINQVGILKSKFDDLLTYCTEIDVNATNIEYIDLSFIQLFHAFKKITSKKAIKLSYNFDLEEDIELLLTHAGINTTAK